MAIKKEKNYRLQDYQLPIFLSDIFYCVAKKIPQVVHHSTLKV
jgi:hypothetical protein